MPIKALGLGLKVRVGREAGNKANFILAWLQQKLSTKCCIF